MKPFHLLLAVLSTTLLPLHPGAQETAPGLPAAARAQIGRTLRYDPAYVTLAYPGGDVPLEAGVCTDFVIRALRTSHALDLQQAVHQDMTTHFSSYPQLWDLKKPDKNIDHRRVPNLQTWFKRQGWARPLTKDPKDYLPGDLVTCLVPPSLPHIMVVSDKSTPDGRPLVLHNIGRGTQEEDRLFDFTLTGHYRPAAPPAPPAKSTPAKCPRAGLRENRGGGLLECAAPIALPGCPLAPGQFFPPRPSPRLQVLPIKCAS